MLTTSLIQFIIIQISFAFSPGLIITLIVRTTLNTDRKSGFKVALGAAVGCLIITITSAYIISFIVERAPLILEYITYIGSSYIIYKAINIFMNSCSHLLIDRSRQYCANDDDFVNIRYSSECPPVVSLSLFFFCTLRDL